MAETGNTLKTDWSRVSIFAILLFDVAALIARSYVEVRLRDAAYATDFAADLSFLVMPPVLLILMYPVLKQHGHLLLMLFRPRDLTLRVIVAGIGLGLALRCVFWGALITRTAFGVAVTPDPQLPVGPALLWQCPAAWPLALGILVKVLMIPLIEECINRGFFLQRLLVRGKIQAIVGSAVLFAVCHNPQTIYFAFVAGLFLAVAALNTRALWLSTIAHATYNFIVQLDWRCLRGQWSPVEATPAVLGVGAMASALMLISMLVAGLLVSKRITGTRPPSR